MDQISSDKLVSCKILQGTKGRIVTNIGYKIINKNYGWHLHPSGSKERWTVAYLNRMSNDDSVFHIQVAYGGCKIKNKNYCSYLHPSGSKERWTRAYFNTGTNDDSVWCLTSSNGGYKIKNKKYGSYLHPSGSKANWHSPWARNWHSANLNMGSNDDSVWHLIPQNYILSATMSDFEFLCDFNQILQDHKNVEFIDEHRICVDQDTVGSSISRTFTKQIADTFSWGMDQRIGVKVSLEVSCGVPLFGEAKATVEASAELGTNQQWTNSTTRTVSATAHLVPQTPGQYKMSGWVDIAENVEFPFKAKTILKAEYGGTPVSANGVKALFLHEGLNAKILSMNHDSVLVEVTGKIRGNYGLKTFTDLKKI